jgi:hypothetical protein
MSGVIDDMAHATISRAAGECGARKPFLLAIIRIAVEMLSEMIGFDETARYLAPMAHTYARKAASLGTAGGRNRR